MPHDERAAADVMKRCSKLAQLLFAVSLVLCVGMARELWAQTFRLHHLFKGSDGAAPCSPLVSSSGTLYGTTQMGGSSNYSFGTVFAINTNGTSFRTLYNFTGRPDVDGAFPAGDLLLDGSTLYGVASGYLSGYGGTIFSLSTDGSAFKLLHSFSFSDSSTNSDGALPMALVLSRNTLYGTALIRGPTGAGTVFAVNTDGTGFTVLHSFNGAVDGGGGEALIISSNILYGTTSGGGIAGNGTVFAVNTDGTGFTVLHSFNQAGEGSVPLGLTLSSNILYGTTEFGGSLGKGTVFALNTDGSDFRTIYNFSGPSDGAGPVSELLVSGNVLYGTTAFGGPLSQGTLFALHTDGTGVSMLHSFNGGADGQHPLGLVLAGSTLYGVATAGGVWGQGTLFGLTLPQPRLTIILAEGHVVLTWPTNFTGFSPQSTTNLASSVWGANLPSPVIVNGHNAVTNPISATQQFYRLHW